MGTAANLFTQQSMTGAMGSIGAGASANGQSCPLPVTYAAILGINLTDVNAFGIPSGNQPKGIWKPVAIFNSGQKQLLGDKVMAAVDDLHGILNGPVVDMTGGVGGGVSPMASPGMGGAGMVMEAY